MRVLNKRKEQVDASGYLNKLKENGIKKCTKELKIGLSVVKIIHKRKVFNSLKV